MKCNYEGDGVYSIIAMPKIKKYYKLIKQYPGSGYNLGDIVKGETLPLDAVYSDEFWKPVKNKFTRAEIIEIFKKNNASVGIHRIDGKYFKANQSVLADFGLTIDDFIK